MFDELIAVAGDTDSNCSIAGQIAGSLLGKSQISLHLLEKLKTMDEYNWIQETIHNFISHKNFCY
jgi:ADP-ribosylglycohydrolase